MTTGEEGADTAGERLMGGGEGCSGSWGGDKEAGGGGGAEDQAIVMEAEGGRGSDSRGSERISGGGGSVPGRRMGGRTDVD